MTEVRIAPARAWHCGRMVRAMRRDHREALERRGIDVHREMRRAYEASWWRGVLLVDDELVALGGVKGNLLSPVGDCWLCLSQTARHYPLLLLRTMANLRDTIMATGKRELVATVLPDDDAAQRFAAFLGFHTAEIGPGQRAYSKAGRRALIDFMRHDPDCRIGAAAGYVIRMGYQSPPEMDRL